jgi:drug/metabolite transporter (DMT)-like permease
MHETKHTDRHIKAVLQALFVTLLWSTSWILIKIGLKNDLPAVTFAGLRYTLAFLCLVPFVIFNPIHRDTLGKIPGNIWLELIFLGILFYSLTQGAQFVSLAYLPAATLTLLLNFSPVLIALYGMFNSREPATFGQWLGIALTVIGVAVYFLPLEIPMGQSIGLIAALIALLANSGSSIFGRYVNSQSRLHPILVTTISMGIGGIIMLLAGSFTQGFGHLELTHWLIISWLAIVNTAVAFTLWNKSLQTLTAVESSIINGTMLPQIAILAWIFLDEPLSIRQVVGISLVGFGALTVQIWRYLPARSAKTAA